MLSSHSLRERHISGQPDVLLVLGPDSDAIQDAALNLSVELARAGEPVRFLTDSPSTLKLAKRALPQLKGSTLRPEIVRGISQARERVIQWSADSSTSFVVVGVSPLADPASLHEAGFEGTVLFLQSEKRWALESYGYLQAVCHSFRRVPGFSRGEGRIRIGVVVNHTSDLALAFEAFTGLRRMIAEQKMPVVANFLGPIYDFEKSWMTAEKKRLPVTIAEPEGPVRGGFAFIASKIVASRSRQDADTREALSLPAEF